ncbi:acetylcholinesterase-like [Lytechinus variegatus]|uniref:acetylcholinesterase-like n=1 Tax=Lytechinus variegatus TaxID=7654 RepID=UPI001BB1FD07|nr:acetylcholinesterase-like [Lytechinus variegatus]
MFVSKQPEDRRLKVLFEDLGVPFAEPPVRFSPPAPKSSWQHILDTKAFKPACMQPIYNNFPIVDEDCLYLNVYTPSPKPNNAAVLVYIHGGTFVTGSAMTYMYYGVPLVAVGDVIVVTINYRVGIFSRFSTRSEEARGNFGMLDQVEALRWVQRNIAAFGGDRDRVTIFGESAGAASVDFLLLSKLSRGLFSQAIMQSGNSFSEWAFKNPSSEVDTNRAIRLGQRMGCPTALASDLVACLRTKDAKSLMRTAGGIYGAYPIFVDGLFLEDTPTNLYLSRDFKRCPILAGFNKDEGTLTPYFYYPRYRGQSYHPFIGLRAAQNRVTRMVSGMGFTGSILRNAALEVYTNWSMIPDPTANFFRTFVDVETDVYYACTTDKVLRAHDSTDDSKIYQYVFSHEPTKSFFQFRDVIPSTPWLKAGHGEDLTFVFGFPFIDELYHVRGHNVTEEEKALSIQIMKYWTNFAKTGDPNLSEVGLPQTNTLPPWPEFNARGLRHKVLSQGFRNGRAARARQCHFLNSYLPMLKASTTPMVELEQQWRRDYTSWKSDYGIWKRKFEENV